MLTQEDLLAPKGRIEGKSFFPDLSSTDLAARLAEYLAKSYVKVAAGSVAAGNADEAARQYAYYLAFDAVYLSLMSNPLSSSTTEGGSASFALAQAEGFRRMADEALAEFNDYVPASVVTSRPSSTVGVPNNFVF